MFAVALKFLFSILAAVALMVLIALWVAAEFAIVRVRRTRLEELAGQGVEAAKDAILIVDYVSEYLAVTQIGITVASLGIGWLGEDAFASLFLSLLPISNVSSTLLHVATAAVAFLFITTIDVVIG